MKLSPPGLSKTVKSFSIWEARKREEDFDKGSTKSVVCVRCVHLTSLRFLASARQHLRTHLQSSVGAVSSVEAKVKYNDRASRV